MKSTEKFGNYEFILFCKCRYNYLKMIKLLSYSGPQLIITVRAQNAIGGDALRGYGLVLLPATAGARQVAAPLLRPLASSMLGEWLAWLTGRHPELAEPRMLANGKENYCTYIMYGH